MKVHELIAALALMPKNSEVLHLWDGEARTAIEYVWLSRSGCVITSDFHQVCYSNASRPYDAPTAEEEPYWTVGGEEKYGELWI